MIGKQAFEINSYPKEFKYHSDDGYFFIMDNNNIYYIRRCREEFSRHFIRGHRIVGFNAPFDIDLSQVDKFFNIIENKLKLTKTTRFIPTQFKNVILTKPSPFWLKNKANRSLFTLFLRCAIIYYNGNFVTAIREYDLTRAIRPALKLFLKGYTKLTHKLNYYGIVDHFARYSDYSERFILRKNYKQFLVKP